MADSNQRKIFYFVLISMQPVSARGDDGFFLYKT